METITLPSTVILSRIIQPIALDHHTIYCMWTQAGQFLAGSPPTVLDFQGEQMVLTAELPAGSTVRAHLVDDELRTLQLIARKSVNPFTDAA